MSEKGQCYLGIVNDSAFRNHKSEINYFVLFLLLTFPIHNFRLNLDRFIMNQLE